MKSRDLSSKDEMVPGRWYIVEGMMVENGIDASSEEMVLHNRARSEMRRSGPYVSRGDANDSLPQFRDWHNPYVFEFRSPS